MGAPTSEKSISQFGEFCANEFLETLSPEERELFESAKVAEDLLREVEEAEAQYKENALTQKVSPAVLTFIAGVMQYAPALDVFANSNSMLCPIWGSVRIVLHLAKEFGEYFDRLATMLEEMGNLLKKLPRTLRLYPDNENLQKAVLAIYKDIFDFATRAKHVFRVGKSRSRGLQAMRSAVTFVAALRLVWKPFDVQFGDIKTRMAKNVTAIESEADMAEKELAKQERTKDDVRWSRAEASQKLLAGYIDDQSVAKVNEWLAPANVAPNHKAATSLRHADSGTWFLNGPVFQRWFNEPNSFLWLHAIPGAGKTILASSIINYLRDYAQSKSTALAYFYCDYKDIQKQEPSKILGTLLASFGKQHRGCFEAIQHFFLQHYKETSTFTAEFDELLNNFGQFISGQFQSAIIVIDALDETGTANMECISYALRHLHQHCKTLKILVTSRNELLIARAFQDLPSTSIEEANVASDMKNFITAELSAKISQRRLKLRDPTLELTIRDSLVEGSGGMFQWAKCQIDALCKLRNDKAIRAALSNLPKTLQGTYLRILQRVEDDHPDDIDTVRKILCWLVKGIRNLTLGELAEAVSIDTEGDETNMDFDAVDTDPEQILEVLGGLVTVFADKTITLAHYSVKEYLVSEDMKKAKQAFWIGDGEAESNLASVCLTYLCYDDFKSPMLPDATGLDERLDEYKLYRYATQAWALHAHRSEVDGVQSEQVVDLTMRLLCSRGDTQANYDSWIECYRHCKFNKQTRHRAGEPLFVVAFFGLTEAVSALLEEGPAEGSLICEAFQAAAMNGHVRAVKVLLDYSTAHVKGLEQSVEDVSGEDVHSVAESSMGSTLAGNESTAFKGLEAELPKALYSSAAKGHSAVVSLLLDHGTPINARGGRDGTALQAAALEGRSEVVKLLLDRGASHWEPCKRYGTPLAAAAEKAHQRTFNILLENGANPNSRGGWYALPLVSAIVGKNINIIRKLLDAGADVNGVGGRHGGPLSAAAAFGMNDLIKELVGYGANVNDEDDKTSDALYAASLSGHLSTVNLLLELGADIDAKGGRNRNALGAASSEGNIEVVEALLYAGADLEFHDDRWGTALQTAALRGHETVVKMLAEAGMDPNAPPGEKGTALACAAAHGHENIIRTLFELGVESGTTDETTNALVAAAMGGHTNAVQLLYDKDTDVNSLNEHSHTANYCTPLQAAAARGHLDVVKLLTDLGAEVNDVDEGWYGTALTAAVYAQNAKEDILLTLLDAGAEINEVSPEDCHYHGSPLTNAVSISDTESTKLLIDKGADVNLQWSSFLSPLQDAALQGNDELVDLLIEHGADVNQVSEPEDIRDDINEGLETGHISALQSAAWSGHEELVRKLVGLGANLSVTEEDAPFISALQTAAYRGHASVVTLLIELGSNVNERGGYFGSALQAAACRGHLDAVRVLLEAGAEANEVDVGHFHSALLSACMIDISTNIDISKLLIKHGADVNQRQGGPYPYPLHATSKFVPFSANNPFDVLIESGADPNSHGGRYGTPLQAAASQGSRDACEYLLLNGADPNITGGFYNSPLQAAYRNGWYLVIHLLYQYGARNDLIGGSTTGGVMGQALGCSKAHDDDDCGGSCPTLVNQLYVLRKFDPNLEYGLWGNALQNMVMENRDMGLDEIIPLLKAGADVNKVGGRMGTASNAAAFCGSLDMLEEFITRGADLSLGNHRYPNAAFGAIKGNERKCLQWLIEKGVNVKDPVGYFGTALQSAALHAQMSMLRMLIRAGAEINTPACGRHGSPLQAAIVAEDVPIIRYLINHGADVRATGGYHGGILNAAAIHCATGIIERLLQKGADVNERGRIYGSPLQAAASNGDYCTALLLLRYGANIDYNRGKYGTALQAACAGGWELMVKLLVEKGADPNIVGGHYRTALHAAAIQGYEDIVRYLLEHSDAKWSLVDRKKLGHVEPSILDFADELLQRAKEPVVVEDEDEETDTETEQEFDETIEVDEEEDTLLLWNVDSIPQLPEVHRMPLSPLSKWTKVQEMSFHSFSQRYLQSTSPDLSTDTFFETSDSPGLRLAMYHSVDSTVSNSSSATMTSLKRFQSKTASRKATVDSLDEEVTTWDSSVLDEIQLVLD